MTGRALLLVALLTGCSAQERGPEARPRARPVAPSEPAVTEREPTLPDAPTLGAVLRHAAVAPRVRIASEGVAVARGDREQAELWPNPTFGVRADRIDVNDVGGGAKRWRVMVSERLETAGKRGARTEAAGAGILVAVETARAERIATALEAARLHQRAVSSALLAAARREARDAAEARLALQETSVRAGRAPESSLPALRSRVGRLRVEIVQEEERGRRALRALEGVLALPTGSIRGAAGEPLLAAELPVPGDDATPTLLRERNPELAALRAEGRRARASVEAARSGAWPDVTVGMELEDEESRSETADHETMLGVFAEVPLPIADRNQGRLEAARAEVRRTDARELEAAARLVAGYAELHETITARRDGLRLFTDEILPARERDLALARAAHEAGRTDRAAVLEARIALAEAVVEAAGLEETISTTSLEALALLGGEPETWAR